MNVKPPLFLIYKNIKRETKYNGKEIQMKIKKKQIRQTILS